MAHSLMMAFCKGNIEYLGFTEGRKFFEPLSHCHLLNKGPALES